MKLLRSSDWSGSVHAYIVVALSLAVNKFKIDYNISTRFAVIEAPPGAETDYKNFFFLFPEKFFSRFESLILTPSRREIRTKTLISNEIHAVLNFFSSIYGFNINGIATITLIQSDSSHVKRSKSSFSLTLSQCSVVNHYSRVWTGGDSITQTWNKPILRISIRKMAANDGNAPETFKNYETKLWKHHFQKF